MSRQIYQPHVSVVVPVRNGAATIGTCIEALLSQNYPPSLTELIVVDNGSTDQTREVVATYPVALLTENAIRTSYAARNCGILYSHGDIVALTDADCIPVSDWLSDLVAALESEAVGAALGTVEDARRRVCAKNSQLE